MTAIGNKYTNALKMSSSVSASKTNKMPADKKTAKKTEAAPAAPVQQSDEPEAAAIVQQRLDRVEGVRREGVHIDAAVVNAVDPPKQARVMQRAVPRVEPQVIEQDQADQDAQVAEQTGFDPQPGPSARL